MHAFAQTTQCRRGGGALLVRGLPHREHCLQAAQPGRLAEGVGGMSIEVGVNMEFIRSQDKPFAVGVERAAKLGYRYVEPMVHNGRELLSEAGYFHSVSMDEDPLEIKEVLDRCQ